MICLRCLSRLMPIVTIVLAAAMIYGVGIPMIEITLAMNGWKP